MAALPDPAYNSRIYAHSVSQVSSEDSGSDSEGRDDDLLRDILDEDDDGADHDDLLRTILDEDDDDLFVEDDPVSCNSFVTKLIAAFTEFDLRDH